MLPCILVLGGLGQQPIFPFHTQESEAHLRSRFDWDKYSRKIKIELSSYDKKLSNRKEIIFFNKSDLFRNDEINKKLLDFKNMIKTKYEIISVFSNKDVQKIKKLLVKYAS